ncbi:MAG: tyrosine-type recombinase/integrase [Bacillota bacterium]
MHKFLIYPGQSFNYKSSTIARRVNCLRSFFNFCVDQDYIIVSPDRKIKPPKLPKRIPVYLREGELQRLLHTPESMKDIDEMWLQDKAMLHILAFCGLRRSELLSLNWDNIDFKNATLKVRGKGDLERIVPLKSDVCDLLWDYLQTRLPLTHRALFLNEKGNRLDKDTVRRRFRACVQQAGLDAPVITPHKLRHTFHVPAFFRSAICICQSKSLPQ